MNVQEWVDAYGRAWRERDPDLAASIFTEDAVYCSDLFEEPARGQDGVREYWSGVTATQSDIDLQLAVPIADGNKALVEFWTKMKNGGADVTLAGAMLVRFGGDGRAEELREYWFFREGAHDAPAIWGK
jgi:ketosteroid isomerase-like protein